MRQLANHVSDVVNSSLMEVKVAQSAACELQDLQVLVEGKHSLNILEAEVVDCVISQTKTHTLLEVRKSLVLVHEDNSLVNEAGEDGKDSCNHAQVDHVVHVLRAAVCLGEVDALQDQHGDILHQQLVQGSVELCLINIVAYVVNAQTLASEFRERVGSLH